jgi:hypothetical protein
MIRPFLIAAASVAVVLSSSATFAQQAGGSASEAKAMLTKAVVAVKENKTKAIELFNTGAGGFLDRDLYVFCNKLTDGEFVAMGNPNSKAIIGKDVRTLKDAAGSNFGQDIFAGEQKPEGVITEVSYMYPKPGADKTPVPKISLVTKAGDLGCGVGYYK